MKVQVEYVDSKPYDTSTVEIEFEPYDTEEFAKDVFEKFGDSVEIDAMIDKHKSSLIDELSRFDYDLILKEIDISDIISFLENEGYKVGEE